jgi:site-specific recombinase XerD
MYRTKVILKSVSKVTNLGNLVIEATFLSKGNRARVYIPTNEKVISHHFLGSKISKTNPNHKQIWERVEVIHGEVRQHLFEIEAEFGFCNADLFRKKYFKEEIPQEADLLSLFKDFIELKRITLKPKLVQKLQAIEKHLNEFLGKRKVYPIEFNQLFVNKLASFWRNTKAFQPNTISKNFKFLRQFLNHLHNEDILNSSKYRRLQYPKEVETFAVVLSREEVIQLINYQPETSSSERVKDLFLILIYTGLRFSDAIRISKSWVKGEFLIVNTQKTGERISIPIHHKLKELLSVYGYDVTALKISNQKFNDYVKILCEKAEINDMVEVVKYQKGNKVYQSMSKFQLISSHTGRRTFITNSILAGIPLSIIQSITGHKKLATVQKYVRINENDSVNQIIKLTNFFS